MEGAPTELAPCPNCGTLLQWIYADVPHRNQPDDLVIPGWPECPRCESDLSHCGQDTTQSRLVRVVDAGREDDDPGDPGDDDDDGVDADEDGEPTQPQPQGDRVVGPADHADRFDLLARLNELREKARAREELWRQHDFDGEEWASESPPRSSADESPPVCESCT
jgi:hypothetical protein